MLLENYSAHCLQKQGVTESFPFNDHVLVYKVANKVFTLANIHPFEQINVKCDAQKAIVLRERHHGVIPGFHMNKKHWNTLLLNSDLQDQLIYEWIDHSYQLVIASLPKSIQQDLGVAVM